MRLKEFRVQKYKGIIDSGWVELTNLTVIVGKNESGKTSLLKALHKFNPFKPEPYVINREWPRGRRKEQDPGQVVCSTRFELTDEELAELSSIAGRDLPSKVLEITKDYSGRFEVQFAEDVFPQKLHPNEVDEACEDLPVVPEGASDTFADRARACREEAVRLAHEGRFSGLSDLAREQHDQLGTVMSTSNPARNIEDQFRTLYKAKLDKVAAKLEQIPTIHAKAHEFVVNHLPTFIYMDDYRTFTGSARLDEMKSRKDQNRLTDEDKTVITLLELSGLDFDEEVDKASGGDREQRLYDLDDAGRTLTREIEGRWKQRRYEVQFHADGPELFTMVRDERDVGMIRLEERSKGFQWFFSFDLMFMYESKGTFKGCIVLLDEPGLHLHPDGQRDLLGRLEAYAAENLLIYTTHLPFMIDVRHPDRIKVVAEGNGGTAVSDNLWDSPPEAKLTLQAALGMSGRTSFLVAQKNLVVEGVDDFWILSELSNLLGRAGNVSFPEDLHITAAGGASEAVYVGTFMIGQDLEVAVLLDSDQAGNDARDRLVNNWLTRYRARNAQTLRLGEIAGLASDVEFGAEDLFPQDFYLRFVQEAYNRELTAAGAPPLSLSGGGMLVKRVARAMQAHGIKFNKGKVAKRIRRHLSTATSLSDLPPQTVSMAEKVISAINAAFATGR